jgi:hypothetical protein
MLSKLSSLIILSFCLGLAWTDSSHAEDESSQQNITYLDNLSLRQDLKVGAGIAVGGGLSAAGLILDLNFEDENGAVVGFSNLSNNNSFWLAWKHNFSGDYLSPFFTLGYSRWYNAPSSSTKNSYEDSSVLDQALDQEQKRTGQYGVNFAVATFGAQYNQLSGDLAGLSFYGEVSLLTEVSEVRALPYGGIGILYYF